jgi:GTP pyrophosphokinase
MNLYSKIYVLHKRDIKSLPKNNFTGLLFSIHSEIGIKTRGTRVNGSGPSKFELKMVTK